MMKIKVPLLLLNLLFAQNVLSFDLELLKEDLSKNKTTVISVDDALKSQNKKNYEIGESLGENNEIEKIKITNIKKYCGEEIKIFCSNTNDEKKCLIKNKDLLTGKCLFLINEDRKKGINIYNEFRIHDLKLSKDIKFFGYKKEIGFNLGIYKTNHDFIYRGIKFRKGFLKLRNYANNNYREQFVLYSAKPKKIFKDVSGIEYNPFLQKGEFFFDEKGNVKIGTLNQDYKYKNNIVIKKGSLIAFDDNRNLLRGVLKIPTRIGKCGFIENMIINEEKVKECLK